MRVLSKAGCGLIGFAALLLLGGTQAKGLQIVQSEGVNLPFACVTTVHDETQSGTPVLASDCGRSFAAFWQFSHLAILAPGSINGVLICLAVNPVSKLVLLKTCTRPIINVEPKEQWYFHDGQVISLAITDKDYCLDSQGKYSNSNKLPNPAQLKVTPCKAGSLTQTWRLN
jgi:hypothetical protein